MSNLKSIDAGALANLPALRHFQACSNRHFSSIHPHAFANPDVELQAHIEWPPLQSVCELSINFFFSAFFFSFLLNIIYFMLAVDFVQQQFDGN